MQRIGEFEKVSYEQFYNAAKKEYLYSDGYIRECYNSLKLPERATRGSAGYDFVAFATFSLEPGETITIPTGIRVKIDEGWWLGILPRSSLGFKYGVRLCNTLGTIDCDYYNSDNEGHIFIKITNGSKDKVLTVKRGDRFAQGIFLPFGITYSDDVTGERNGGIGSTNF